MADEAERCRRGGAGGGVEGRRGVGITIARRRQSLAGVVEVLHREAQLLHLVAAGTAVGSLTRRLDSWQKKTDERANDGNHDEQFDEREAAPTGTWGPETHATPPPERAAMKNKE